MRRAEPAMTLDAARATLGVDAMAPASEVRRAFREAAKRAHPDRAGGAPEAFRQVMEAYRRLTGEQAALPAREPVAATPGRVLSLTPAIAFHGGVVEHVLAPGRRVRVTLPAGVRGGDKVAVDGCRLTVEILAEPRLQIRGDDVWLTVTAPAHTLSSGGRIAVETPIGRRIVWITRKAGERGLLRLVGQGMPARGRHARGHLFLRLAPEAGAAQSNARTLLRRFAAAWAA